MLCALAYQLIIKVVNIISINKKSNVYPTFRKISPFTLTLSKKFVSLPRQSLKNMNTQITRNSLIVKGGGYRPAPDVIVARLKNYHWCHNPTIGNITIADRRIAAFVLAEHFDFRPKEIAEALHVSKQVIYRDLDIERFDQKRNKRHQEVAATLRSYILYNAKYIP